MIKSRCLGLLAIFALSAALVQAQESAPATTELAEVSIPANPSPDATATTKDATKEATTPAVDVPPIPMSLITMGVLAAKYDKYAFNAWDMPFPSVGDSLIGDKFGIRDELAKYKIGYQDFNMSQFSYNLRQAPMTNYARPNHEHTAQIYNGQRPTGYGGDLLWIGKTFTDRLHLNIAVSSFHPTWPALSPHRGFAVSGLSLQGKLFKDKLIIDAGYLANETVYYQSYIAGNLAAGTLGSNAVLPYVVGQSASEFVAPGVNMKYLITKNLYHRLGFQRSMPAGGFEENDQRDRAGVRFMMKGARLLTINEFGYNRKSAPGEKSLFIRADSWFNTTHYTDFRWANFTTGKKTDNNFAFSLGGDAQVTQPNKYLPFQGVYVGATTQYAPPQQNVYTQYYEIRAYKLGTFKSRPTDMCVAVINRLDFSQIALKSLSAVGALYDPTAYKPTLGVLPYFGNQTNIGVSYGYHPRPGVWITPVVSYTRHPAPGPRLTSPVWAQINANLFW